jgi:GAF domain-containing protein
MAEIGQAGETVRDLATPAEIRALQRRLVNRTLRALILVGPLAAVAGSYYDYVRGVYWSIPLYWLALGILAVVTFWTRVPFTLRVITLVLSIYGIAILDFLSDGRTGSGRLLLLLLPFLAVTFFGLRRSVVALVITMATVAGMGWAFSTGVLAVPPAGSSSPAGWISNGVVLLMVGTFVISAQSYVVPRLTETLIQSRRLATELAEERSHLETLVAQRTADLEQRSIQLQTAAQVARDAAEIRDVEKLLRDVVDLISTRFGFYHTGVFLMDRTSEAVELRAASSPGGRRMLMRGYKLKLGVGLVGNVAQRGVYRIALDVDQDTDFYKNPELPNTRSEIALPLRTLGDLIGVLDVQSTEAEAFDEEDVVVLQTLADQVAVAIHNARLFQQAQRSLEVERHAFGEVSLAAWRQLFRHRPDLSRRYDPQRVLSQDESRREVLKLALEKGEVVPGERGALPALAIPLKVRDRVIGVLDAYKPAGTGDWTDEEINTLQTLVEQMGVALDSARLYEDAQRRAARDRVLTEIATHMRESLDVETVMRTAVRDMRQALGVAQVEVYLAEADVEQ